jgi:hypothetical protein
VGSLTLAALIAAVIGVVAYGWYQNSRTWDRLRSQATAFKPPSGFVAIGQVHQGSGDCFISCDSPRVTVVYRTSSTSEVACDELRSAVALQIGSVAADSSPPSDEPSPWCAWRARAASVGDRAYVFGGAETANALRGEFAPRWTDKLLPTGTDMIVWIEFNSGLD